MTFSYVLFAAVLVSIVAISDTYAIELTYGRINDNQLLYNNPVMFSFSSPELQKETNWTTVNGHLLNVVAIKSDCKEIKISTATDLAKVSKALQELLSEIRHPEKAKQYGVVEFKIEDLYTRAKLASLVGFVNYDTVSNLKGFYAIRWGPMDGTLGYPRAESTSSGAMRTFVKDDLLTILYTDGSSFMQPRHCFGAKDQKFAKKLEDEASSYGLKF